MKTQGKDDKEEEPELQLETNKLKALCVSLEALAEAAGPTLPNQTIVFGPSGMTITFMNMEDQRIHELRLHKKFFNTYICKNKDGYHATVHYKSFVAEFTGLLYQKNKCVRIWKSKEGNISVKSMDQEPSLRGGKRKIRKEGAISIKGMIPVYYDLELVKPERLTTKWVQDFKFCLKVKTSLLQRIFKKMAHYPVVQIQFNGTLKTLTFRSEDVLHETILHIADEHVLLNPCHCKEAQLVDSDRPRKRVKRQQPQKEPNHHSELVGYDLDLRFNPGAIWDSVRKSKIATWVEIYLNQEMICFQFVIEHNHSSFISFLKPVTRLPLDAENGAENLRLLTDQLLEKRPRLVSKLAVLRSAKELSAKEPSAKELSAKETGHKPPLPLTKILRPQPTRKLAPPPPFSLRSR